MPDAYVIGGILGFSFVALLAWSLCKAAARGDRWVDELEPRRKARDAQNGIGRVDRAS